MNPLHDDDTPLEPRTLERLEAHLAGLERVVVPPVLRARVATDLTNDDEACASRQLALLGRLARRPAPSELRRRIDRALAQNDGVQNEGAENDGAGDGERERRVGSVLGALEPITAPDALRERVRLELSTSTAVSRSVRELERQRVPPVLERLVAEEIADDKAVAKRFVGSLPKPGAPADLRDRAPSGTDDGRLTDAASRRGGRIVRGAFFGSSRRFAAAAGLLLAAGATLWVVGRDDAGAGEQPTFRLQHRVVTSLDELDPMAQGVAVAFGMSFDTAGRGASGRDDTNRRSTESSSDRGATTDGGGR